ncbi:MAG: prolipoprotein diacylglyceryl transferase [Flavobacteriales bacterium]|nr:prolipoprotein diacylglyceryl transferase [Flavobacteriales bacterium]MBL6872758.1 prolipoprotein diacylglyceryl transferase [Flavobacteriales bacterium]
MYPNISYLLNDLFGINIPLPIQTFGFFVAIAFLLSSWTLSLELKRKEKEGLIAATNRKKVIGEKVKLKDLIIQVIIGFLVGYKLLYAGLNYSDFASNPQHIILSGEGHFLGGLIGAFINAYLKYRELKKEELKKPKTITETIHPYQLVGNITMIAAISGIVGAKIFHNLENINEFMADPIGQLLSFSGLTFYGGLICGAIAVIYYTKKYGINYKIISDASAPGLMLAYGIGRMGCHFSGDGDWGITNLAPKPEWMSFLPDWTWAYTYPNNVINAGVPIEGCVGNYCNELLYPVFPTPIYEIAMALALFGLLWTLRTRINIAGMLFGIYMIMNGLERFFIEKIRVNTKYIIFETEITQAELISFGLIITGMIIVYRLYSIHRKKVRT